MQIQIPVSLAPPNKCPHCNAPIKIEGAYPRCANNLCWYRIYGRLRKYVETLDVKGSGEETLKQLARESKARTAADLFEVSQETFTSLDRQGVKGYQKFKQGLEAKQEMSVSEFFAALDIEGKGTFEAIVSVPGLQTIDEILNAARGNNVQLLAKAERVSPTKARSIIDQINSRILEIESLKKRVKIKVAGTTLIGKGFCITGTLTQPRREIENKIKDAGGKVYSDVNSKTHYLICNETNSTSSKMKKAQQLRISVITEDTFNQMLT